jgi:hypothetical protein
MSGAQRSPAALGFFPYSAHLGDSEAPESPQKFLPFSSLLQPEERPPPATLAGPV